VSLGRYAVFVLAVVAGSLGLVWLGFGQRLTAPALQGIVFGGVLAAANTLAAYGLVRWSEKRSANAFMGAVLGGMVGRMGLMLAAVVGAVLLLGLPKVPLAVSLLSYFVLFLVFEIAVLHKQRPGAVEVRQ
jgi:MFS family permease